jgi:hypothetical protein
MLFVEVLWLFFFLLLFVVVVVVVVIECERRNGGISRCLLAILDSH